MSNDVAGVADVENASSSFIGVINEFLFRTRREIDAAY